MAINQAIIEDLRSKKAALLEKVALFDQMIAVYETESGSTPAAPAKVAVAEAEPATAPKKRGRKPGSGRKAAATTIKATPKAKASGAKRGPKKISLRVRILTLINEKNTRFHSAAELGKVLAKHYPGKDRDKFMRQMSAMLSQMKSKGEIVSYSYGPSRKETAWGKSDWLNSDGSSKSENAYKL